MARLGRGIPVPPVISRSSLVDVAPGDYPLRPVVVVPPDRSRTAARVAYRRANIRHGLMNGTGLSFLFPAEILQIGVLIAPGASATDDPDAWPWVDITTYGMSRADTSPIRITRGATSENTQAPVARMTLQLNNRDGRFSTQNYNSPYWPTLVRGTPIRVTVTVGSTTYTRFTGRLDELPPRWDVSGNDRWVPVTASGIMRRLGVGVTTGVTVPAPVVSASEGDPDIVGSWPCTDTAGSGAVSAVDAGGTLCRNDDEKLIWAQVIGPDGMTLLPSFSAGGVLSGAVPTGSSTTWTAEVEALVDGTASGTTLYPLVLDTTAPPASSCWSSRTTAAPTCCGSTPPAPSLRRSAPTTRRGATPGYLVAPHSAVRVRHPRRPARRRHKHRHRDDQFADVRPAHVHHPRRRPDRRGDPVDGLRPRVQHCGPVNGRGRGCGRVHHGNGRGPVREVGAAQPVPYEVFGASAQLMGPQSDVNFLAQLRECEAVDCGLLSESRHGRIALWCRELKENAAVALTLDMSAGEVAPPFEPDDSDATTVNSQTATLSWDSSATATVTDQDHIDLYELYEGGSLGVNAASRSQVAPHAGLPVWLGTYAGYRYPRIKIALHRDPQLAATCVDLDFHQRITLTNPSEPPYDDIDVLLIGCTEELGQYHWMQTVGGGAVHRWAVGCS
jgi:hypothetical protein